MSPLCYLLLVVVDLVVGLTAYLLAGSSLAYGVTAAALALPPIILLLRAPIAIWQRPKNSRRAGHAIIICGPAGSGKTTLFLNLSGQANAAESKFQQPLTAPSAAVNEAKLANQPGQPSSSSTILLDVPGSEKVRDAALTEVLPAASKFMLVLDATNIENIPTEAPFIIRVLAEVIRRRVPCTLVLGKQDLGPGSALNFLQALDTALNSLSYRVITSSEDHNEELAEHVRCIQDHLGMAPEDPIDFDSLKIPVMCYSSKDEQSLAQLQQWICDA